MQELRVELSWKLRHPERTDIFDPNDLICGCCGKKPEIKDTIHYSKVDPLNKRGMQYIERGYDFHLHHLIYFDGHEFDRDICIWLCNKCHMRQHRFYDNTVMNRFLRLQDTSNREKVKVWCREWLDYCRMFGKGRNVNTWRNWAGDHDVGIFKEGL